MICICANKNTAFCLKCDTFPSSRGFMQGGQNEKIFLFSRIVGYVLSLPCRIFIKLNINKNSLPVGPEYIV
jgi:hypothetical protein